MQTTTTEAIFRMEGYGNGVYIMEVTTSTQRQVMKIINSQASVLVENDPIKKIEKCGRVCYKSEDKINIADRYCCHRCGKAL